MALILLGCGARTAPTSEPSAVPRAASTPERGETLFGSYCAACHQYDGQAVGEAPPLDGASWVSGPEDRLIRIALHGIRGRLEIQGQVYDREMPGFARQLTDADLSALLSYVRRRFGKPSTEITPEAVQSVREAYPDRADYWSVEELLGGS